MQSTASTVDEYLASLPPDRRDTLAALREVILAHLDQDLEEVMQYGMICYCVPHRVYPAGYHCNPQQPLPVAGLAAQKNHLALYLMCAYLNTDFRRWFEAEWAKSGKKLDMGKSCVRFKRIEDVPLDAIAKTFKRVSARGYIKQYESALGKTAPDRPATAKAERKQPAKAKTAATKSEPAKRPVSKAARTTSAGKAARTKPAAAKSGATTRKGASVKKRAASSNRPKSSGR